MKDRTDLPMHYSELAAMRRCPQKHQYAYVEGLQSKHEALNLKRGVWLHAMLQADALKRGLNARSLIDIPETIDVQGVTNDVVQIELHPDTENVQGGHQLVVTEGGEYADGFDLSWKGMLEILEHYSDYAAFPEHVIEERYTEGGQALPEACRNIMRGYLWQWREVLPQRKPLLVEVEWTRTLEGDHAPVVMQGRADLVEIDEKGVPTIVDWKTTKSIPGQEFKLMESQRWIYAWGLEPILERRGIKIRALAFDYLVTSTPTVPKQNQPKKEPKRKTKCPDCEGTGDAPAPPEEDADGDFVMSCPECEGEGKRMVYPTPNELKGELSKAQIRTTPLVYFERLKELGLEITEYHREKLAELEESNDFYARFPLPLNKKVLATILAETGAAAQQAEHFRRGDLLPYRNVDRSCDFMCDFQPLCMAELYGQDAQGIRDRDYELKDPDPEAYCNAEWVSEHQNGRADSCDREPGHRGNHRGAFAEWQNEEASS